MADFDKVFEFEGRLVRVMGTQIIGTEFIYFTAYEPTGNGIEHSSTFSAHHPDAADVKCWGQITTQRLPKHLDALPAYSDERLGAVKAMRHGLERESIRAIYQAKPELKLHPWRERDGEVANYFK